MSTYIHGETQMREAARLETQAAFVATFTLPDLELRAGQDVLDLGCGVGAMTAQLARCFPGIRLVGVDIQLRALRIAQTYHPTAVYLQADATHLPFGDATFDFVHGSWLLEHLRLPQLVLREVHRVLKVGGHCHFIEVDNASFRTIPEFSEVRDVLHALNRKQIAAGGDPHIGQRLSHLLAEAGFTNVAVHPKHLHGDVSDPGVFQSLIAIFADIFASVDQALGAGMGATIGRAASALQALPSMKGGAISYTPVIGRGSRA